MSNKKSVFKNKNFLLLFQGALTSNVAATFYSFALSFYILTITNNDAFLQGIYLAVCGITFVLFSFVGGVLADRWNRVKIIYLSDFIKGILIIIAALPMIIFIKNNNVAMQLVVIFIIGIVNNVIAAVFSPASAALFPELVEEDLLQQANSYFSILSSFIGIFGIILAGILYAHIDITVLFILVGILYVLSGVSELFIKSTHLKKEEGITVKTIINDFFSGLKFLWELKPILYIMLGALFLNFFFSPFASNLLPYIIKTDVSDANYLFKDFITPEMWLSILYALFGVGSLIMAIIMSQAKQIEKQGKTIKFYLAIVVLANVLITLAYYLYIDKNISVFLITISILIFIIGVAIIGVNIPISVAIQKNVPKGMLAKVSSVMNIGSQGLIPFASLIAGAIIAYLGSGILLIFLSVGLVIVTTLMILAKEISNV